MDVKRFAVIDTCELGDEVSLVVFQDNVTKERAVQLLPITLSAITPEVLQEQLEWPTPLALLRFCKTAGVRGLPCHG